MKTLIITCILLAGGGCYTDESTGAGWRTELYTSTHNVTVKAHPTNPNEWQALANSQCVDILTHVQLPDANVVWKQRREMTGCIFSFHDNFCTCKGPRPVGPNEGPQQARFSTMPGKQTMWIGY